MSHQVRESNTCKQLLSLCCAIEFLMMDLKLLAVTLKCFLTTHSTICVVIFSIAE